MTNDKQIHAHAKLHLNLQFPDLEDVWADGYFCGQREISENDNPYTAGSTESEYWMEGYMAGLYGEEPLFDLSKYEAKVAMPVATAATAQALEHSLAVKSWLERLLQVMVGLMIAAIGFGILEFAA